ncbi:uncharacterized protein LOC125204561 isoform X2 [Salvia hispanica]|uniref:uncharacterized protein LOC125204561 isoform X2 n=1 Tax=Salvia hispanica TaxID=49212 RepID=UPI002008F653|nr:uncharacterized protein LOC125204561 isoform X2 [Salvia hispanica]
MNTSDRPRPYEPGLIKYGSAPPIIKSWLPTTTTTTRCVAGQNQPPQLRHVTTSPTRNPTLYLDYPYLHDSTTVVEAASSETPDASTSAVEDAEINWTSYRRCFLRHDPTAWLTNPDQELPTEHPYYPNLCGSFLRPPEGPSSGLMVDHTVSLAVYRNKSVSVWHECVVPDPFDPEKKPMEFTSALSFRGNHYAMSLQGALAVMQVVDTRLTITAVATGRGVPRSKCRFFKEYLCEMNGEILLVLLIHRETLAVVDDVEVLRLDLVRMDWVKVERLPGKAVFLGEYCSWVDSEEFGCMDDRVYFMEGSENVWKVYNMTTCSISLVPAGWSWDPLVGP